jgi:hypothetical protein
MAICLSLDMSIDREDFLRLLPAALSQSAIEQKDGCFFGGEGDQRWRLRLLPLAPRRLGSVVLPRHQVEFSFEGYSESEVTEFMARFHRAFQRGGG